MKPFDIKKYTGPDSVCYRNGAAIAELVILKKAFADQPLITVDNYGVVSQHDMDGTFSPFEFDGNLDLMMKPVMKEGWVNIYVTGVCLGSFKTKEEAILRCDKNVVATIKIEWEEEE